LPAISATAARASTCRSISNCSTTTSRSSSSPAATSKRAKTSSSAWSAAPTRSAEWSGLRARVLRLENGPPIGFPVQFRVSGEDLGELRRAAEEVATVMRANPHLQEVSFDWNEMGKVVRIDVDQDRARARHQLAELAAFLNSMLNGISITQMREDDQLIDVVARAAGDERARISALADINIPTASGRYVPLAQLATISYELEDGLIARRNRLPTVTVRADIRDDIQAPVVTAQIDPQLDALRARLPAGFRIEPAAPPRNRPRARTRSRP
jgi:multidrug efflux pump